jgi:hypothetical protein
MSATISQVISGLEKIDGDTPEKWEEWVANEKDISNPPRNLVNSEILKWLNEKKDHWMLNSDRKEAVRDCIDLIENDFSGDSLGLLEFLQKYKNQYGEREMVPFIRSGKGRQLMADSGYAPLKSEASLKSSFTKSGDKGAGRQALEKLEKPISTGNTESLLAAATGIEPERPDTKVRDTDSPSGPAPGLNTDMAVRGP